MLCDAIRFRYINIYICWTKQPWAQMWKTDTFQSERSIQWVWAICANVCTRCTVYRYRQRCEVPMALKARRTHKTRERARASLFEIRRYTQFIPMNIVFSVARADRIQKKRPIFHLSHVLYTHPQWLRERERDVNFTHSYFGLASILCET